MNKNLTIFILTALILTAVASATVYEPNYVYDGNTNSKLTGVSVIGFVCNNADCTSNTKLWTESLNTGNDNAITLSYPTQLKSSYGYKVYFYKPGYVPYKVNIDWFGEGTTPNQNDYLYKITDSASAPIDNFQASKTSAKVGETVTISADILSPRLNTKNVKFIPSELKNDYYSDKVKVILEVNGNVVETENLNMFWSTDKNIEFSWKPASEGTYNIKITTKITDNKFTNAKIISKEATIKVSDNIISSDTTKPTITITYPVNGKTYNKIIKYLNFEVEDESPATCKYSTDNGETKYNIDCDAEKIEINSHEGINKWIIYAVDSYGNSAEKSVTFEIDFDYDETGKTPSGYRDLNKGDTLEDEQYQNQFKPIVLTSEEEQSVKLSLWQKFINWIKYIFRSLFWFLY